MSPSFLKLVVFKYIRSWHWFLFCCLALTVIYNVPKSVYLQKTGRRKTGFGWNVCLCQGTSSMVSSCMSLQYFKPKNLLPLHNSLGVERRNVYSFLPVFIWSAMNKHQIMWGFLIAWWFSLVLFVLTLSAYRENAGRLQLTVWPKIFYHCWVFEEPADCKVTLH